MPSPFPGMDPFLEGEMWQEFSHTLVNQISQQLMPQLRPKYVALLARRESVDDSFAEPEPIPYLAIEIRDVAERRLVIVIEIHSPENKRGRGFRDYTTKRIEILETDTHLIEIDLLRLGQRIELIGELPCAAYYALFSHWTRRPNTQVFPIQLRDPLPTIPIPLLPPDPDVQLDLQAALDACFDLVGYERLLNYMQTLPELSADDAVWIKERLHTTNS